MVSTDAHSARFAKWKISIHSKSYTHLSVQWWEHGHLVQEESFWLCRILLPTMQSLVCLPKASPKSWVDTLQVSTKMPSFGWVSWSHFLPSFWFSSLAWVVISSQWLSTFKTAWKSNKLEMQMGQIKDAILQWPIFARIYARGEAGTAVAGNKLTLTLNSIEQDSAVARLSHFWIYFSKICLLETFFRSQTYLISTVIHCSKKQKCLAKNIYFDISFFM